ncbi:MAG: dCTP deaminase [bacterium]
MVLSKTDILAHIQSGELKFSPEIDGFQLQPHAIDLRLGFVFQLPKTWEYTAEGRKAITVDPLCLEKNNGSYDALELKPGQFFEILPNEFVIGTTLEIIELNSDNLMAVLYPRSSINRRGLAVDLSGIIDVHYKGQLMIPIMNNTRDQIIRIYPGERICQVVFQTLSSPVNIDSALQHGLTTAKYHDRTGFTKNIADKKEEMKLIEKGKIAELKKKYALK